MEPIALREQRAHDRLTVVPHHDGRLAVADGGDSTVTLLPPPDALRRQVRHILHVFIPGHHRHPYAHAVNTMDGFFQCVPRMARIDRMFKIENRYMKRVYR